MFKFSKISILAIGLSFGFVTGLYLMGFIFTNFDNVQLQFDVLGPFSLLITIFVAFYVTDKLNKSNEKTRIEKNLIIDDLKNFKIDLLKNIKFLCGKDEIKFIEVTSRLKSLRMRINSIIKLINVYDFCGDSVCSQIDKIIRDINDIFTDKVGTIVDGRITLDDINREKINILVSNVEIKIFEIIVDINRK